MKSVLQDYRSGEVKVVESSTPQLRQGWMLIRTAYSVISAGTEKTKVDMGTKSLIGKARSRPDLVRQVVAKAQREGLWRTWQTVQERLSTPTPLGYCAAGEVIESAGDVNGMRPGDRVACGGSTANHAEVICVPRNLVVPVPSGVPVDHAAFATLGAIAMQGVRQADVRVGEKVAVIGLGLIGLITVQILRAAGCRVFGIDIATDKLALGVKLGCADAALANDESLEEKILSFSDGYGVDVTIITAASSSNQPIEQSAEITRERGRVVVVGLTRMELPREPFYLKELELRLSRSYGPGRYDKAYEDEGVDYPYPYVRFTERRNMISFLELVDSGQVEVDSLISHRFAIDDALKAYALLQGAAREPYLGILLEYPRKMEGIRTRVELHPRPVGKHKLTVGVIGAGKYAVANLLPFLRSRPDVVLGTVCTASGVTAAHVAERMGFAATDADVDAIIRESDAVLIATRHNEHAPLATKALAQGKPVFVEKPLAITAEQLGQVRHCLESLADGPSLMVGFNRRFAPATRAALAHLESAPGPRQVCIRVNAGPIPADHWIQDPAVGGGRLLGEGCHFVDLAVALAGSIVKTVAAVAVVVPGSDPRAWDTFSLSLGMSNGSIATVTYGSTGAPGLAKERIEVHGGGRSAVIDDYRRLELWSGDKQQKHSKFTQDKGQSHQMEAWILGLKEGRSPIPPDEILNVHAACFAALESLQTGAIVTL